MPENKAAVVLYVVIYRRLVNFSRSRPSASSLSSMPVVSCDVDASVKQPEHKTSFPIINNEHANVSYPAMKQDVNYYACSNNSKCFVITTFTLFSNSNRNQQHPNSGVENHECIYCWLRSSPTPLCSL